MTHCVVLHLSDERGKVELGVFKRTAEKLEFVECSIKKITDIADISGMVMDAISVHNAEIVVIDGTINEAKIITDGVESRLGENSKVKIVVERITFVDECAMLAKRAIANIERVQLW